MSFSGKLPLIRISDEPSGADAWSCGLEAMSLFVKPISFAAALTFLSPEVDEDSEDPGGLFI